MGMDFSTQEKIEDVEVFLLDNLATRQVKVDAGARKVEGESWLSLLVFWIREWRWRMKFWNQSRD